MHTLYIVLISCVVVLGVVTFLGTMRKVNPYGRYMESAQGRTMPALPAWLLFESPQWFSFALNFWWLADSPSTVVFTLFVFWQSHYLYRAVIYPPRMKTATLDDLEAFLRSQGGAELAAQKLSHGSGHPAVGTPRIQGLAEADRGDYS